MEACSRTCLIVVVTGAVEVELAVGCVGCPAGTAEEAAQRVVGGDRPQHGPTEPVGGHGVDGGLEQPRAVAEPALVGVDGELHQLGVDHGVGVGVGGRRGDREPDHAVAFQGDQHPDPGVGGAAEDLPPGGLGSLEIGLERLGREERRQVPGAGALLQPREGRGVVGPGDAARDVGGGTAHVGHPDTATPCYTEVVAMSDSVTNGDKVGVCTATTSTPPASSREPPPPTSPRRSASCSPRTAAWSPATRCPRATARR